MLGHLQRELYDKGIWPLPAVNEVQMSTKQLYDVVKGLKQTRRSTHHVNCVLTFEPEGGFDSYKVVLDERDVLYMTCQGVLTGLVQ